MRPQQIDYFARLPSAARLPENPAALKAIFSLGAGVDGFLRDPEFPRHLPLVRFVDDTLQREMAQYVTMHVLIIIAAARLRRRAGARRNGRSACCRDAPRDMRIGILGLGDIGTVTRPNGC